MSRNCWKKNQDLISNPDGNDHNEQHLSQNFSEYRFETYMKRAISRHIADGKPIKFREGGIACLVVRAWLGLGKLSCAWLLQGSISIGCFFSAMPDSKPRDNIVAVLKDRVYVSFGKDPGSPDTLWKKIILGGWI